MVENSDESIKHLKELLDTCIARYERETAYNKHHGKKDMSSLFQTIVSTSEELGSHGYPEYYLFLSRIHSPSCSLPFLDRSKSSEYRAKYREMIFKRTIVSQDFPQQEQLVLKLEVEMLPILELFLSIKCSSQQ